MAAAQKRIYTTQDDSVSHALEMAVSVGLVSSGASQAEKLRMVVHFADEHLTEQADVAERIMAYQRIAKDEDRSQGIWDSMLDAVEDGIL